MRAWVVSVWKVVGAVWVGEREGQEGQQGQQGAAGGSRQRGSSMGWQGGMVRIDECAAAAASKE